VHNHLYRAFTIKSFCSCLRALKRGYTFFAYVAVSMLMIACGDVSKAPLPSPIVDKALSISETQRLNDWFEQRYEEELAFSPIELTFLGRKEHYDKIDDFSEQAYLKKLAWQENSVKDMKASFDYMLLSDEAKMSYDMWEYRYQIDKEGEKFYQHNYIFEQMSGAHSFLPTFIISFHKVDVEADMLAYNARIVEVARAIRQLVAQSENAAKRNIRPPRFAYEIVKEEVTKLISGRPFADGDDDSPIWADAKQKVKALQDAGLVDDAQGAKLLDQTKTALLDHFEPAYTSINRFIDADIANTTDSAQGVHGLPDGLAFYDYRLKKMTTTRLSANEIHELGVAEVKRLRTEMDSLRMSTGFKGDLQAFFAFIRDSIDDPRFYYSDDDQGRQAYIDDATLAIDNIKAQLPNYFGLLPKAGLVVKRVEAFREQPGAAQHYYPGTPDGSRAGTYYAHLSDMKAMPKNQLEVIAYHEGLPGHHMQISIAQELESVPTFRQQVGFTAYTEGWALYSEQLASEMPNTYIDPYSKFGRLSSEIWRAIRLVVDTGLHAKGWSEQQAVDYFSQNSPEPLESIRSEVRRYLVLPGQATSYKIGMIDILRLREKARTKMGDAFDIRAFHDTILGGGALPLTLLERRVDQWIASQL